MSPDSFPSPIFAVIQAYQTMDFSSASEDYYIGVCSETSVAVKVVGGGSDGTQAPTVPGSGGGEGPQAPTVDTTISSTFFATCKTALLIGDSVNRDDILSEAEYVRFLCRLVPSDFCFVDAFACIPPIFQSDFEKLA